MSPVGSSSESVELGVELCSWTLRQAVSPNSTQQGPGQGLRCTQALGDTERKRAGMDSQFGEAQLGWLLGKVTTVSLVASSPLTAANHWPPLVLKRLPGVWAWAGRGSASWVSELGMLGVQ